MEVAGLFAEIRKKLRVDQGSARGSVKLFFSPCTKCPALSGRTDLVYAPVPRRRNESTDLAYACGVPACGKSLRTKKIVFPRPPSIGYGYYAVLFQLAGGQICSISASIESSSPAVGAARSHKWSFGVLR